MQSSGNMCASRDLSLAGTRGKDHGAFMLPGHPLLPWPCLQLPPSRHAAWTCSGAGRSPAARRRHALQQCLCFAVAQAQEL